MELLKPLTKTERSEWINKVLDEEGIAQYGRASHIVKTCGVSHAIAQGWLRGSLSRDATTTIKFCDQYNISLRSWVTGQSEDEAKALETQFFYTASDIQQAREFEATYGSVNTEQFILVLNMVKLGPALFEANIEQMAAALISKENGTEKIKKFSS